MKRIAIIGAGITGLTAAWHLKRAGADVTVFEASTHVGGNIRSQRDGEWLVDAGPNTILLRDDSFDAMFAELGLTPLVANPEANRRYIVKKERLVALPTNLRTALTTRLLGIRGKLRLLLEPIIEKNISEPDEPLSRFMRRRCGKDFVDYVVNPFVGGIYACEPGDLCVRHAFPKIWEMEQTHGSLFKGMRAAGRAKKKSGSTAKPRLVSFAGGLGALPSALEKNLTNNLRTNARVTALRREATSFDWTVQIDGADHDGVFDAVLLTLPPKALAKMQIEERAPLQLLDTMATSSVNVVSLGFKREDVEHPLDGFGMLVPQCEGRRILGTLFSSTIFPHRTPDGHVLLTTFVGGRQPQLAALNDEALLELVRVELRLLLGVSQPPIFSRIDRWPQAIARYGAVFETHRAVITKCEDANSGIFVAGAACDGISVPDCLKAGVRAAEKILRA